MASSNRILTRVLIRYINKSTANKEEVERWLMEVIRAIADGKGSQLTSASLNGFFTQSQVSLNFASWATILDAALQHAESGTMPTTSYKGVLR